MLKNFAATHRVGVVVVSIGGNDFEFGSIVRQCAVDYAYHGIKNPIGTRDYRGSGSERPSDSRPIRWPITGDRADDRFPRGLRCFGPADPPSSDGKPHSRDVFETPPPSSSRGTAVGVGPGSLGSFR